MSEFSDAIKAGDRDRVAALLDADPTLAAAAENNVTPLLLATYYGKAEIARLLAPAS